MSLSLARSLVLNLNKLMVPKAIELNLTKKFYSQKINPNLTLATGLTKSISSKSDLFFKKYLSSDSKTPKEPQSTNPIESIDTKVFKKEPTRDEVTSAVAASLAIQDKEANLDINENEEELQFIDTELDKFIKIKSEPEENIQKLNENHPFRIAKASPISTSINNVIGWQPTVETHKSLMVDGVPYEKIPIVHVKSTPNNTLLCLTEHNGSVLFMCSSGTCGFKNKKRSSAVAAQAAGIAMSNVIKRRGIKNVRIMVKGFGNGRLPSIKAIQISKINIVSITDNSPIPLKFVKPNRPPLPRRV